jgi:hypothetical protein
LAGRLKRLLTPVLSSSVTSGRLKLLIWQNAKIKELQGVATDSEPTAFTRPSTPGNASLLALAINCHTVRLKMIQLALSLLAFLTPMSMVAPVKGITFVPSCNRRLVMHCLPLSSDGPYGLFPAAHFLWRWIAKKGTAKLVIPCHSHTITQYSSPKPDTDNTSLETTRRPCL